MEMRMEVGMEMRMGMRMVEDGGGWRRLAAAGCPPLPSCMPWKEDATSSHHHTPASIPSVVRTDTPRIAFHPPLRRNRHAMVVVVVRPAAGGGA